MCFSKSEITRHQVIVRLRQAARAISMNLDNGEKPEVVVKKFNKVRDDLKKEIKDVRNSKTQLVLLSIVQNTGDVPAVAKRDAYALRGYASKVDAFLPSVLDK